MKKLTILIISIFVIGGIFLLAEFAEIPYPEGKAKDKFIDSH